MSGKDMRAAAVRTASAKAPIGLRTKATTLAEPGRRERTRWQFTRSRCT
jgi:hypothetical protein